MTSESFMAKTFCDFCGLIVLLILFGSFFLHNKLFCSFSCTHYSLNFQINAYNNSSINVCIYLSKYPMGFFF